MKAFSCLFSSCYNDYPDSEVMAATIVPDNQLSGVFQFLIPEKIDLDFRRSAYDPDFSYKFKKNGTQPAIVIQLA
jgi:hypothetical protein